MQKRPGRRNERREMTTKSRTATATFSAASSPDAVDVPMPQGKFCAGRFINVFPSCQSEERTHQVRACHRPVSSPDAQSHAMSPSSGSASVTRLGFCRKPFLLSPNRATSQASASKFNFQNTFPFSFRERCPQVLPLSPVSPK